MASGAITSQLVTEVVISGKAEPHKRGRKPRTTKPKTSQTQSVKVKTELELDSDIVQAAARTVPQHNSGPGASDEHSSSSNPLPQPPPLPALTLTTDQVCTYGSDHSLASAAISACSDTSDQSLAAKDDIAPASQRVAKHLQKSKSHLQESNTNGIELSPPKNVKIEPYSPPNAISDPPMTQQTSSESERQPRRTLFTIPNDSQSATINLDRKQPPSGNATKSKSRNNRTKTNASRRNASAARQPDDGLVQTKLEDYFTVRRSFRRCKSDLEAEERKLMETAIVEKREYGMAVKIFEDKGRGVVATKSFRRGEFVVEYAGELVTHEEAQQRESNYAKDINVGCYMYYFNYQGRVFCIDATAESGRLGRLVNHSARSSNCFTKVMPIGDRPHLVLIAKRDISVGQELLYDYGDRSTDSLQTFPWLKL